MNHSWLHTRRIITGRLNLNIFHFCRHEVSQAVMTMMFAWSRVINKIFKLFEELSSHKVFHSNGILFTNSNRLLHQLHKLISYSKPRQTHTIVIKRIFGWVDCCCVNGDRLLRWLCLWVVVHNSLQELNTQNASTLKNSRQKYVLHSTVNLLLTNTLRSREAFYIFERY